MRGQTATAAPKLQQGKRKKKNATCSTRPRDEGRGAVLRDLRELTQERRSRDQTVFGRFLQCQELQDVLSLVGQSDRAMFAMAPRASTSTSRRVPTAEQLMAPECGVVLPRLNEVPVEHRFLADDRETIRLAEILVTLGIGAVEDWSQSGRDPTKYASLTLQRWIRNHGGATIDRRFDLDVSLSDRLVDYSDERGPRETLYLIVDPEAAAFAVLKPTLEFLEKIHPPRRVSWTLVKVGRAKP